MSSDVSQKGIAGLKLGRPLLRMMRTMKFNCVYVLQRNMAVKCIASASLIPSAQNCFKKKKKLNTQHLLILPMLQIKHLFQLKLPLMKRQCFHLNQSSPVALQPKYENPSWLLEFQMLQDSMGKKNKIASALPWFLIDTEVNACILPSSATSGRNKMQDSKAIIKWRPE